jgi:hypothetical protein
MTCSDAFRTEKLVYIPGSITGSRGKWADVHFCIWDGPKCLRNVSRLKDFYPEHHQFFCGILGLTSANWETLREEALNITACDNIEHISQVFVAISSHLKEMDDVPTASPMSGQSVQDLKQSRIFPVKTQTSHSTFDRLSTAQEDEMWFIADRLHLRQIFEGRVPLLALNVESVEKIRLLIQKLGLEHRLLSKVAHGIPKIQGTSELHLQYTTSLRRKSRSIARYVFCNDSRERTVQFP